MLKILRSPERLRNLHIRIRKGALLDPYSSLHAIRNYALPSAGNVYDEMSERREFVSNTVRHLLFCCSEPGVVGSVMLLHSLVMKTGALSDVSLSTSFLTLYARAGHLDSSWSLFDGITHKDVICWNAMISACVYRQCFQMAVTMFATMMIQLGEFDSTTLVIVLTASSFLNKLRLGEMLHGMSLKFEDCLNPILFNALLDMYFKCGVLTSAVSLFLRIEFRDVISWNSMITGFLHNGFPENSLLYFRKLSLSIAQPDDVTISSSIAACSSLRSLDFGESLHGFGIKQGYDEYFSVSIANSLISFYAKCNIVESAEKVFRELAFKDVISWNSMIAGLAEAERVSDAFDLLRAMQSTKDVHLDSATLVSLLPLCEVFHLWRQGRALHGFAVRRALISPLSLRNSLLDMYVKCGCLGIAQLLFQTIDDKDLVSWNTMINGYSLHGRSIDAKILFCELFSYGPQCSLSTALAILPSCDSSDAIQFTKSLHSWMIKSRYMENLSVINALMYAYVNCGDLRNSLSLFESVSHFADLVSWNSMIVGCSQNGHHCEALEVFNLMRGGSDIYPDSITLTSVLSASGTLMLELYVKLVHACAHKILTDNELRVRNALITAYCRCGDVESAEQLFLASSEKNLCSWNCIISGFAQNKESSRALELFRFLEVHPNEMTYASILSASTQLGALGHGREIHAYVIRFGIHDNGYILSALVDLYSKCGRLETATLVFSNSAEKSIASWNSMISAYGFYGYGEKAIELFEEMCKSETAVTKSTFIALLSACSHSGLVDDGWKYYKRMVEDFGVEPSTEHHVCMVHLLGRAGRLGEAYNFVKQIPYQPASGVLGAFLSACKDHGDVEMGKNVAEQLFCLAPENAGYYVSLSNIYAAAGRWIDADEIRKRSQERGLIKPAGSSQIDLLIPSQIAL